MSVFVFVCVCVCVSVCVCVCVEMSRVISETELSTHNTVADCWIAIDGIVYDVTKFLKSHPAGAGVILAVAGREVSEEFFSFHKKEVLAKFGPRLRIGVLHGQHVDEQCDVVFDTSTPFAESTFVRGWSSAYMDASHLKFRESCRQFVSMHVLGEFDDFTNEDPSDEVFEKLGSSGIIASRVGKCAMPFVHKLGINLPSNLPSDKFNHFHEMICVQEIYRIGNGGVSDGLGVGATIGLPPVLYFGKRELKEKVAPEVLLGKRRICLAITEPIAGSDVANITTTAVLNEAKTHYVVNGIKKWITGGYPAHYFTAAVRTGGPGHAGISLLLIETPATPADGRIIKHKIKTSYSGTAGTSLLIFENVLVPRENLLGSEGDGFKLIMANFNHERWYLCVVGSAFARTCVAECYRWAIGRKAFGKRLIDQPVIRYKLAEMSAMLECLESWLESITVQMDSMSVMDQFEKLAAPIALMKFQFSRFGWKIADNATQILGGRGVTQTGMGKFIERFKNEAKFTAITGGSEEIIADLAIRQVVGKAKKSNPNATRL